LPGSVHILPVTDEGKIRLVKEKRLEHNGEVKEKITSGIIENGESSLEAAKRELKEELGLVAETWKEIYVTEQKGVINDSRVYYSAQNLTQEEAEPDEEEEIVGQVDYTLEELFQKVLKDDFGSSPTAVVITRLFNKTLEL
jgi:ADP-ribose pyrophosphatase